MLGKIQQRISTILGEEEKRLRPREFLCCGKQWSWATDL